MMDIHEACNICIWFVRSLAKITEQVRPIASVGATFEHVVGVGVGCVRVTCTSSVRIVVGFEIKPLEPVLL